MWRPGSWKELKRGQEVGGEYREKVPFPSNGKAGTTAVAKTWEMMKL